MTELNNKKKILVLTILTVIFTIMGSTLAYWSWMSTEEQKTTVTFTTTPEYSCSVDGEGNITENDAYIMPTTCTDPDRAIQRTITANATINEENVKLLMDLWLDSTIDEALINSGNFKYAITTEPDSCTTGVVKSGSFTSNKTELINDDLYLETDTKTYYLYIWLDAAESNTNTMGKSFNISLNGQCTSDSHYGTKFTGEDGQYEYMLLGNNKIQITRYLGSETNVVIPATYEGYQVYSVGNPDATSAKATRYNIFNTIGNTTVTSVTIEDGVEEIKLGAFDRCSGMTTLSLPDSVTLIDDYAFYQCTKLAGTLDLPSNLVEMGRLAFSGDTKITGELVIPNTVTTMDAGVFQQCSGLTSVTFEENSTLTSIPEYTFYKCTNLAGEINLPNTITSIGQSAFYELTKLTGDLVIPNAVTTIGKAAFQGCTGFNGELTLSSNLVEIGDYAFNHCSGFTNTTLDIPSTLQKIGSIENNATHVFYDFATKTIEEYTVNNSNNGIGTKFKVVDGVLYTTDGTRMAAYPASKVGNSYVMPEGVTTIDELAFSRAGSSHSSVPDTGLKSLTLPNSYVISTTFPSNYLNVGNTLTTGLYIYTGVNEILVKADNPNYASSDGILYSKDGTELWYIPNAKTGDITIPNTVTTIRNGSLALGRLAATSLYIPASVTNIEATAILEINQLLIDNITSVTFDPNCVYQINASNRVEKTS